MTQAPHRLRLRVYWEDTDASGVVYHANYLRWFERGRSEWLREQGQDQTTLIRDHNIGFTVARISVDYRRPARLDDELEVLTGIDKRGHASLEFRQILLTAGTEAPVLAEAQIRVACIDAARFTPRRLPDFGRPQPPGGQTRSAND